MRCRSLGFRVFRAFVATFHSALPCRSDGVSIASAAVLFCAVVLTSLFAAIFDGCTRAMSAVSALLTYQDLFQITAGKASLQIGQNADGKAFKAGTPCARCVLATVACSSGAGSKLFAVLRVSKVRAHWLCRRLGRDEITTYQLSA